MSTTVMFKDLNCVDEFIEYPLVEPVIVYMKYGKGDGYVGITPDVNSSIEKVFEPSRLVIRVFAKTAYKLNKK